ncbi:hypothetical protein HDU98_003173 [Podochytrium sp. JEL0797]|nr:hypothetical protein HDU98_003173 [Podochytrium sp. JEL0797]
MELYQKLERELDYGFFHGMGFKVVGFVDSEDDEEDDFGRVCCGAGVEVGKRLTELVFEEEEGGVKGVKAGSVSALVTYMWANLAGGTDQKFPSELLLTYWYFALGEDVARLLALSYLEVEWWSLGAGPLSEETLNTQVPVNKFLDALAAQYSNGSSVEDWTGFLQLRILNVFKKWIDVHPDDFATSRDLLDFTTLFLEKKVEKDVKRAKHSAAILANLKSKVKEHELNKYMVVPTLPSLRGAAGSASNSPSSTTPSTTPGHSPSVSNQPPLLTAKSRTPSETLQPEKDKNNLAWTLRRKFSFKPGNREPSKSNTPDDDKPSTPTIPAKKNFQLHARATSTQINEEESETASPSATTANKGMSIAAMLNELNEMAPAPTTPTTARKLSDLDPTIVAKQLTLLEHNHFRKIHIEEFYAQSWSKKKPTTGSSNSLFSKSRLVAFINWFNRVAYGVATEVLKLQVLKERVTMLKRLIFIAELCGKWHNYNTLFEIVAGLNLGPISRLSKTWKALPAKYLEIWTKLNKIASSESSYRTYRHLISQLKQSSSSGTPVLPYLGVNLSDLTFTEDGNSSSTTDDTSGEKLVNFSKFRMIAKLLTGVLGCQAGKYEFEYDDTVQRWLRSEWEAVSSKQLYELSLVCEPRAV